MKFADILGLADSIYKLTKASRYARTAMYNAMQTTLLYNSEIETKIIETHHDVVIELQPKKPETPVNELPLPLVPLVPLVPPSEPKETAFVEAKEKIATDGDVATDAVTAVNRT